jgi:probable rRNA maturation factor
MPSQQSTLLFDVATPGVSRRDLRAFVKRLQRDVAGGRAFGCLIAGDAELRRLNREFRKQDYATDVLSFPVGQALQPADPLSSGSQHFLGEIAISFETARQQASDYGHSVTQEIEILLLHGVLHLLGMDHETDHGRMSRTERQWRATLALPPGLIERVRA